MGFDRSKFKGTSLATLKEQQAQQEAVRPSSNFDRNFLKVDDGDNVFRIMPFHPDGGGSSYAEAKTTSFLSVLTQKRDDSGKKIDGKEVKRRPIFHAKVHGNYPFDLVDSYLDVAKKVAIPNCVGDDEKAFKSVWNKLTGMDGIKPQDVWAVYAMKATGVDSEGARTWGPIGLLELKKTMKTQLQDLASAFSDGVQSPDPYSDPEEGIAIIINKSGKKIDTEYKVSLESQTVREKGKITTEYVLSPLSDEQLQALEKLEPLYKMYRNVFKRSDLEAQIDGLSRMDAKLKEEGYDINVFGYDEFTDIVNKMIDLVPEDVEEEEEEKDKPAKPSLKKKPAPAQAPVVKEQEEEEEEQEEEEQEEVKEEVRPRKAAPAPVLLKKEALKPHVAQADNQLSNIMSKLKLKKA